MDTTVHRTAAPVSSDPQALAAATGCLGLTVEEEIHDGGSPARVYRAHDEAGQQVALKVLVERPGRVDGHDLAAFTGKLTQTNRVRAGQRRLAEHCLPIRHAIHGTNWAAYTTPFYPSRDSVACLRESGGEAEFMARHEQLVTVLHVFGYGQHIDPAHPGWLDEVLAGRFLRRFPALRTHLPDGVADADELVVNGVRCTAPRVLLGRLVGSAEPWWRRLAPPQLMFPAHGDANTRNVLAGLGGGPRDFRLIDPRGSTASWDPVYDLAKTLFSLTVWDPALRLGPALRPVDGRPDRWEVSFRRPVFAGYRTVAHRFLPHLSGLADLAGLLHSDPHWRERLLLTHALHVLAEAACRLSDRKPRRDPDGFACSPEDLALAHYLLGTLLLDDLVRQLSRGTLDVDRHLQLVTTRLPNPPP